MQFQCRVVLCATDTLLQSIGYRWSEMEISLKNKYRSELLSSCTESNQHVPLCEKSIRWYTNGDEAVAFKKKEAPLLVYYCQGLTQSISPSSASDMAERSSARSTASPPASCSAYCTTVPPGDQQVRREPIRTDYLCFPVSCVRRRRISPKVDPWQPSAPFHVPLTPSAPHSLRLGEHCCWGAQTWEDG